MRCARCLSIIDDESRYCPHCGHEVVDETADGDYAYEAFISYRHLPRDRRAAMRIQRSLEGMRIPREAREKDGPTRLGKLFRDEDELPTSDSLTDQIREALKRSRYLIVVASPEMRESMWVQREVELFSSLHGRDRVIVALTAGEPDESFPELLLSRLEVDQAGKAVRVASEPIAADLREGTGKRFGVEVLRIAARLIGCGFDDLRQRQRARRMRLMTGVASVVAAVSVAFGSFALYQRAQIVANLRQAQIRESEALAVESGELLAQGDRIQAIEVALAALPESSSSSDRPLVPAAQLALEKALELYPTQEAWRPLYSISDTDDLFATSEGGLFATRLVEGSFLVGSVADGREVCTFDPIAELSKLNDDESTYSIDAFFVGERLLVCKRGALGLFDPTDGTLIWATAFEDLDSSGDVALSPDLATIAVAESIDYSFDINSGMLPSTVKVYLVDASTGDVVQEVEVPYPDEAPYFMTARLSFNSAGDKLAIGGGSTVTVLDLTSGSLSQGSITQEHVVDLGFAGEEVVAIGGDNANPVLCTKPFSIDLFDEKLNARWSKIEESRSTWDAHGNPEEKVTARYLGTRDYEGFDGTQVVCSIACDLLMMRLEDGTETYRLGRDAPVIATELSSSDTSMTVLDGDGNLIWRIPRTDGSVSSTMEDTCVQALNNARLWHVGETEYASFWDRASARWRVFAYSSRTTGVRSAQALEGLDDTTRWAWSERQLVALTKTDVVSLSSTDFTEMWRVPLSTFASDDESLSVSCLDEAVYVCGGAYSHMTSIFLLSLDDGSVLDRIELDAGVWDHGPDSITEGTLRGAPVLVVVRYDKAQVIDRVTHEALLTLTVDDGAYLNAGWIVNDDVVLHERNNAGGRFRVFDANTGEELACDLAECITASAVGNPPFKSFTPEGDRLVVACSDGSLRSFETSTWSCEWKRSDVAPSVQFLSYDTTGEEILAQDGSGVLILLDARDGSARAASTTTLPGISWCRFHPNDPAQLIACWQYSGPFFDVGVATVSIDENCFGPLSDVFLGLFCSDDGASVLGYDNVSNQTVVFPRYTLDELIALGHEEVAGRELTEAERHIYRIS